MITNIFKILYKKQLYFLRLNLRCVNNIGMKNKHKIKFKGGLPRTSCDPFF